MDIVGYLSDPTFLLRHLSVSKYPSHHNTTLQPLFNLSRIMAYLRTRDKPGQGVYGGSSSPLTIGGPAIPTLPFAAGRNGTRLAAFFSSNPILVVHKLIYVVFSLLPI